MPQVTAFPSPAQDLAYAPDGSSFVAHGALVYKPHMLAFLGALGNASVPASWAGRIIDAVDPAHANLGAFLTQLGCCQGMVI